MPNEPGVRNVPWQTYQTTVDQVETLTGYDVLALLEDDVERAVESGTQPPIAAIIAPGSSREGDAVPFNAGTSVDPNGSVVSYAWDFGDGATGEGVSVSHVFAQDGAYTVRLTVTDNDGLTDSEVLLVTVANVEPAPGLAAALPLIDQLVSGHRISRALGVLLKAQVIAAQVLIGRGNEAGGDIVIRALLAQIDLLVRTRVVTAADVAPLRAALLAA
jgi:hypothetical protein